MIVADASLVVDFLIMANLRPDIVALVAAQERMFAPELMEFEVGSVLRKHNLRGDLPDSRAAQALAEFRELRFELFEARSIAVRAWELRHNLTYYDASYVALAELLGLPLYTLDRRLAASTGHAAKVISL